MAWILYNIKAYIQKIYLLFIIINLSPERRGKYVIFDHSFHSIFDFLILYENKSKIVSTPVNNPFFKLTSPGEKLLSWLKYPPLLHTNYKFTWQKLNWNSKKGGNHMVALFFLILAIIAIALLLLGFLLWIFL